MAKKTSKKSGKKPARKSAKAARVAKARKAAKPAKKAARKGAGTAPKPVKTGRGSTPRQIGDAVVAHFNKGGPDKELWAQHWHPGAESVEGEGMAMAWKGRKAIAAKSDWWVANNTVHSASAEGPYVGATGFSIKFRMDVEEKASGKRTQMEEVGVYTVQNGKVIREEFMYGPSRVISEGRAPTAEQPADAEPEAEPASV
jgi:hypothetical protein